MFAKVYAWFARFLGLSSRRASRRFVTGSLALEGRALLSQVPTDIYVIHGLQVPDYGGVISGASGRGVDKDIQDMATAASKVAHAVNGKSKVIDVDWASTGDPNDAAQGIVGYEKQILRSDRGPHDVVLIAFSRGSYVADASSKALAAEPSVRRIQQVFLDPTGVNNIDDRLKPLETSKVHTISYHDGKRPYGGFLTVDEYPLSGDYRPTVGPFSKDGTASHEYFPTWYRGSNSINSNEATDLLSFLGASSSQKKATSAALQQPRSPGETVRYNAPGHGQNLTLAIIESAIAHYIGKPQYLVVDVANGLVHAGGEAVSSTEHLVGGIVHAFGF